MLRSEIRKATAPRDKRFSMSAPSIRPSQPPSLTRRGFLGAASASLVCRSFVVWASEPDAARPTPGLEALYKTVQALIRDAGAEDVGVAYHDLATGEELLIHADDTFHAASTMKVPIMMEIYRQAEGRTLSLDDRIVVKKEFPSLVDGKPFLLRVEDDSETGLYRRLGERLTIRELMRLMITESSNVATNLLVERVGAARTTEFMKQLGAESIRVLRGVEDNRAFARGMNNTLTARGLMRILTSLAERKVVSAKASEEMIAILRAQKFAEGIPAGLPAGVSVAHKTGSFGQVYHDAAIVEPPRGKPFVLVVLTRGIAKPPRAHKLVADITRAVYQHAKAAQR
jgi:beta-lactamase class A